MSNPNITTLGKWQDYPASVWGPADRAAAAAAMVHPFEPMGEMVVAQPTHTLPPFEFDPRRTPRDAERRQKADAALEQWGIRGRR